RPIRVDLARRHDPPRQPGHGQPPGVGHAEQVRVFLLHLFIERHLFRQIAAIRRVQNRRHLLRRQPIRRIAPPRLPLARLRTHANPRPTHARAPHPIDHPFDQITHVPLLGPSLSTHHSSLSPLATHHAPVPANRAAGPPTYSILPPG